MGLRAGGALGRAGAGIGRGAPGGPGPGGGAQGGSIHSGCIAAVHNVPLSVLIRPLPSVLDPAKVQSLVDTIRVRPGEAGRREGSAGGWSHWTRDRTGSRRCAGARHLLCDLEQGAGPLWTSVSSIGLAGDWWR